MPATSDRDAAASDVPARVTAALRAFGSALRDVWQGYWDRPIGC